MSGTDLIAEAVITELAQLDAPGEMGRFMASVDAGDAAWEFCYAAFLCDLHDLSARRSLQEPR